MTETATLICPKCRGEMRTYERNGIRVDQCEDCRGIFLDRGELEQLLDTSSTSVSQARDDEYPRTSHDGDEAERHHARRRTSPTSLLSDLLGGGE